MPQNDCLSCAWCDTLNEVAEGRAVYCSACGHRAEVLRKDCDCRKCSETRRLFTIREREQARRRAEY